MSQIIQFPLSVVRVGEDPGNEVSHITCPRGLGILRSASNSFSVLCILNVNLIPVIICWNTSGKHNINLIVSWPFTYCFPPSPSRKGWEGKSCEHLTITTGTAAWNQKDVRSCYVPDSFSIYFHAGGNSGEKLWFPGIVCNSEKCL